MDGFDWIEEIWDDRRDTITGTHMDVYDRRVQAEEYYGASLSDHGPRALFIIGIAIIFLSVSCAVGAAMGMSVLIFSLWGLYYLVLGLTGGVICMVAVFWWLGRVVDRAHRYQRMKDTSEEYQRLIRLLK